jgi:large subunit ribosomal protein L4
VLDNLPLNGKQVLMVLPQRDENVVLSTRNIPSAKVQHVSSINVIELLKHDYLVMPVHTIRWIELVFGEGLSSEEASQRIADEMAQEAEEASEDETEEEAGESSTEDAEESSEEAGESSTEDAEESSEDEKE